ncbi:MAG TPA: serine hydrolase domain-containing protein [Planctomycetota bacterium]
MIRTLSLLLLAGCAAAPAARDVDDFSRATPEAEGVASSAILSLVDALDKIDSLNSLMIVRHGRVIAEGWWAPYKADANHELYSLSKSFASTAVGLAVAEGKLSIDDEVLKFFPEDAPAEVPANLKAMRVRDLLTMSAGHQDETSSAADQITPKSFLAHPVPHKPGTHFKYNTPATFMCSAIVQKVTGQPIVDYLKPRLFEPLGIAKPVWNANAQGVSLGGYGLRVRTEDIARFGQLYLRKGRWNGKRLLPEAWVELATSRQVSNGSNPKSDWEQGYGFQFWRCRNGAYRGDGAFGQYCVVLPEQDVVIAITSGLKDMQAVLNLIWDRLLPGFKAGALPEDPTSRAALTKRLENLKLRTPEGAAASAVATGRVYAFPANEHGLESLAWDGSALLVRQKGVERKIACGQRDWVKGASSWGAYVNEPAAASAAWTAADTLVVKQCFTETPFVATWTLRFTGDELACAAETNVNFRGGVKISLTGRAK